MQKNNFDNNLTTTNNSALNSVFIVDGDEVVKRNNNEYIYLDAVGGVVSQPEEINTIKNRQSIDVLKNELLGHFNAETGKYEISNNIELELQQIVKVEGKHVGNAVYCDSLSSFGGLGVLKFVVKTSVKKCKAISQLYIYERVKKMAKTVTNTQIQLVSKFERTNDNYLNFNSLTFDNYYRFAWEYFKIVKLSQMFAMSEDEKFLQGWIVRRKLYLNAMDEKLDASIELAESDLLLTRIEILSGLGEYGYKVLARFEELKTQATKYVGGEFKARDQNEILEEAIETYRGQYNTEQEKFYTKQYKTVEKYAKKVTSLKDKNHKQILTEIEERMPTIIEIIKQEDEKRVQEIQIKKSIKDVKKAEEAPQYEQHKQIKIEKPVEVESKKEEAKEEKQTEIKQKIETPKPEPLEVEQPKVEVKVEQQILQQPKIVNKKDINIAQPQIDNNFSFTENTNEKTTNLKKLNKVNKAQTEVLNDELTKTQENTNNFNPKQDIITLEEFERQENIQQKNKNNEINNKQRSQTIAKELLNHLTEVDNVTKKFVKDAVEKNQIIGDLFDIGADIGIINEKNIIDVNTNNFDNDLLNMHKHQR